MVRVCGLLSLTKRSGACSAKWIRLDQAITSIDYSSHGPYPGAGMEVVVTSDKGGRFCSKRPWSGHLQQAAERAWQGGDAAAVDTLRAA